MARRLNTDAEIDKYIATVIDAAKHHAPKVVSVIQPLSDEVRARINFMSDKVEVYERNGKLARTCWVTICGHRYVFTYNYRSGDIDLREKSTQGEPKFAFNNSTTHSKIAQEIAKL